MFLFDRKITSIDIGTNGIKVARFSIKKNEILLLLTGYERLPFETIEKGYIKDISILTNKIEKVFNDLNYRPGNVVMTVPCETLIIRNIEIPSMEDKELEEAIKWEAEEYLPFAVENAALDYIILSRSEKQMELMLVAVKKDVIENYVSVLERLNLSPAVINVQPMALLSLLQYQNKIDQALAVIDIGAGSTKVTIGDRNKIYLARTIDIGGEDFTELLMEEENLDYQQAEESKFEHGIEEQPGEIEVDFDLAISEAAVSGGSSISLRPLARNLSEEISRCLNYYSMKFRGKEINDIYITGGGIKLKNLTTIISNEIGRELKTINPFEDINVDDQSVQSLQRAEEFAVTVGLAVSEVMDN